MSELFNLSSWLLDRHVESGRGDRAALREQGETVTYSDLLARARAAAGALSRLALQPDDRVVLALRDSSELASAFLGALRVGVIPVLANPLLPASDLATIASLAGARALLSETPEHTPTLAEHAPALEHVVAVGAREPGGVSWQELVAGDAETSVRATSEDSPAFWLCTSGTTGRPKLVMHRHLSARLTAETYAAEVLELEETDRCYSVGPLFHAYGLGNALTFPLAAGARAILDPTRPPTPELIAEIVRTEEPTLFFCIPTVLAALVASDIPDDTFESVRLGVSAAEPLPAETWRAFRERFGVEILDGIGSTEALHIFISNRAGAVRPGTSGTPVRGYEARLVDDAGAEVGAGAVGHLEIRGETFATGYWGDSRDSLDGDWLRTGDLYTRSPDGYYTYLGRSDDMLRVGGEWVSPAEVEGVLIEHPAVLEAAVVGRRDELGTQRPVAHVRLVTGESLEPDELREFCRPRLAGYKRPTKVLIVDELPKTTTGKIQRFRLRDDS